MVRIHTTVSNKIAEDVRRFGWTYAQLVRLGYEHMIGIVSRNGSANALSRSEDVEAALKKLGEALGSARTEADYYREMYQRRGGQI